MSRQRIELTMGSSRLGDVSENVVVDAPGPEEGASEPRVARKERLGSLGSCQSSCPSWILPWILHLPRMSPVPT